MTCTTHILLGYGRKGGSAVSDNACKVILALIGLAGACVGAYKEIRLAKISSAKG